MRRKRFEFTPFLYVTPPFLCGIVIGYYDLSIAITISVIILLIVICCGLWFFNKRIEQFGAVLFFVFGLFLIKATTTNNQLTYNKTEQYVSQINAQPVLKGRYWRMQANVLAVKDSTLWQEVNNLVQINIDTSFTPVVGEIITYRSKSYEFDSIYKNYYSFKGVYGKQYVYNYVSLDTIENVWYKIDRFRALVSGKISSIDTSKTQATALMQAITVGDKSELSYETKNDYKNAGVSHLLAISGLHVGIIFAIISTLLVGLESFNKGSYIRFGVLIVVLWGYAILSGFSPSVLRAVIMFSLFSLGELFFKRKNQLNTLLASAFIILAFDPKAAFDISFQLSYIAMLGIVTLYKPIIYILKINNRVGRWAWSLFAVTTSAQLTTIPIVLFYFGQFSLLGFITNYFVWFTVPIIIVSTLLYVATNLHFVGIIGVYCSDLQNYIVQKLSSTNFGIINYNSMPLWVVIIIYILLFIGIIVVTYYFNKSYHLRIKKLVKVFSKKNGSNHPTHRRQL